MTVGRDPVRRGVVAAVALAALLLGCGFAGETKQYASEGEGGMSIRIIAFNDFHGNLQASNLAVSWPGGDGQQTSIPAGGVAHLASAIAALKRGNPRHAVVSAGDMIGASPLVSALFLDEPTIEAFNLIGIDFNAVGNHEFDRGQQELQRMQRGGCGRHTSQEPCRVSKDFPGASFTFLAANTVKQDGTTLFPATAIKTFTQAGRSVVVGFIGMTLRDTPASVPAGGIAGLQFADEARTANALIPGLRAQGAQVIVVVVHEGGATSGRMDDPTCPGLRGGIVSILEKLDPAVDLVISGHTHRAYVCDYALRDPARPFLLTSAGQYGTQVTAIDLRVDARSGKVLQKSARNWLVANTPSGGQDVAVAQGQTAHAPDPALAALVDRYAQAAAPLATRKVGSISASIGRRLAPSREHALGNLLADAQLAATRAPEKGGAQIAFMNPGGVRADLERRGDGIVRYEDLFRIQPFGNTLVVKTFTGAQLRQLLELQFDRAAWSDGSPRILLPSRGFSYEYDLRQPAGSRVGVITLDGRPVTDAGRYRVTTNNFLAAGGDNFEVLRHGTEAVEGQVDIDALETYFSSRPMTSPPDTDRVRRIDLP